MSEHPLLQVGEMLQTLLDGGVDFVLIGGLAAQIHGSPSLTGDVDICHRLDRDNLERLAAALRQLAAIRREMPAKVAPHVDAQALRAGDVFTLVTRFGDLDLLAHPDPGLDYVVLRLNAVSASILGVPVMAAGLDDLIAMKRAAGRPKDRVEVEILGALREELDRQD